MDAASILARIDEEGRDRAVARAAENHQPAATTAAGRASDQRHVLDCERVGHGSTRRRDPGRARLTGPRGTRHGCPQVDELTTASARRQYDRWLGSVARRMADVHCRLSRLRRRELCGRHPWLWVDIRRVSRMSARDTDLRRGFSVRRLWRAVRPGTGHGARQHVGDAQQRNHHRRQGAAHPGSRDSCQATAHATGRFLPLRRV